MSKSKLSFQYPQADRPIQIKLGCFFWLGIVMSAYGVYLTRMAVDVAAEKNKLAYQNQVLIKNEDHLVDLAKTEFQLGRLEEMSAHALNPEMKSVLEKDKKQIIVAHHQMFKCACYQKQLNRDKE